MGDMFGSKPTFAMSKINAIVNNNELDIVRGLIPGYSFIEKFGQNPNLASGVSEVIWDGSTSIYTYLTTGSALYISSSNNTDNQTIRIQGLDENWNIQSEDVILNGYSFIEIPKLWIRVFRAFNVSNTDHLGDVYISDNNTDVGVDGIPDNESNIKAKILTGKNQTNMSIYTIPLGFTGYLKKMNVSLLRASGTSALACDVDIKIRNFGEVFRSKHPIGIQNTGSGSYEYEWIYPIELLEKTDIELVGTTTGAGSVAGGFTILLIEN